MDVIQEDLNKVKKKPYREIPDSNGRPEDVVSQEQWDYFISRNNSIITSLFYGQLKTTSTYLSCSASSQKFEEYLSLSLPFPAHCTPLSLTLVYHPSAYDYKDLPITTVTVECKGDTSLAQIAFHLQACLGIDETFTFFAGGKLRDIPAPMLVRAFVSLFFSYYLADIILGEVAPTDFHENAMDHFVDIFLNGILA